MISILVLTKNEEKDLPGCLESVAWSDDIHVYDSYSTDRTVKIAESCGAKVAQRVFDGYSSQRNAALMSDFKYPWVLILDADERVPEGLKNEMLGYVANAPAQISACRMRRRDFFMGTWLRHAQISPYYIRLVRLGRVHYEREINEVLKVEGAVHDLSEPFDHYPFSKGVSHWLAKHNVYSSMEAELIVNSGVKNFSISAAFFNRDFNERRVHQKALFYRLPFRPLIKWLYMVLYRRSFLDGRAGMTYASLQAFYEYMIVLKSRELEKDG